MGICKDKILSKSPSGAACCHIWPCDVFSGFGFLLEFTEAAEHDDIIRDWDFPWLEWHLTWNCCPACVVALNLPFWPSTKGKLTESNVSEQSFVPSIDGVITNFLDDVLSFHDTNDCCSLDGTCQGNESKLLVSFHCAYLAQVYGKILCLVVRTRNQEIQGGAQFSYFHTYKRNKENNHSKARWWCIYRTFAL